MNPLTNVVITSWNALPYTKVTIDRLFETVHHPFYLTIVDNGSNDDAKLYIENLKPTNNCVAIKKVFNTTNIGPGAAINQGYKASKWFNVDYTCLCNNDVYFQDNWLRLLENSMSCSEKLGAVAAMRPAVNTVYHLDKTLSAKQANDSIRNGLTIRDELTTFFGGKGLDRGFREIVEVNGGGLEKINHPSAIITCCALIRNAAADDIGFMADPRYKVYGTEDIDFSWELHKHGYDYAILKDVYVHHFRHRSLDDNNLDRVACLQINNEKFFKKWSKEIIDMSKDYIAKGWSLEQLYESEDNIDFWFLRRINDTVKFYAKGEFDQQKFNLEGVA